MHQASRSSLSLSGYLRPESISALLHDLSDALQLVVISEVLAGQWPLIAFSRSALARYLRVVFERTASASRQVVPPARIAAAGNHAEGC